MPPPIVLVPDEMLPIARLPDGSMLVLEPARYVMLEKAPARREIAIRLRQPPKAMNVVRQEDEGVPLKRMRGFYLATSGFKPLDRILIRKHRAAAGRHHGEKETTSFNPGSTVSHFFLIRFVGSAFA